MESFQATFRLTILVVAVLVLAAHLFVADFFVHQETATRVAGDRFDHGVAVHKEARCNTNGNVNPRLEPFSTMPRSFKEGVDRIVAARKKRNQAASLVQIGANDGRMYDPFYDIYDGRMEEWHSDWVALLVEPQPELYSRVAVLHTGAASGGGWAFYHGAVAGPDLCKNGTIEFCETRTPGEGSWQTQGQINTVDAARCNQANTKMHLKTRPCVTSFPQLLEHGSPQFRRATFNETFRSYNLDFLQIDVEGADYSILQMVDWGILKPQCVRYEQHHLGVNKASAREFLESKGYTTVDQTMDVMACLVVAKS